MYGVKAKMESKRKTQKNARKRTWTVCGVAILLNVMKEDNKAFLWMLSECWKDCTARYTIHTHTLVRLAIFSICMHTEKIKIFHWDYHKQFVNVCVYVRALVCVSSSSFFLSYLEYGFHKHFPSPLYIKCHGNAIVYACMCFSHHIHTLT